MNGQRTDNMKSVSGDFAAYHVEARFLVYVHR